MFFTESAHWADSVIESRCPQVCLSVPFCSLRLNVFLHPLPEVRCPNFLDIQNPWGKVMETSGLRFENCSLEVVSNRRKKKKIQDEFCLSHSLILCETVYSTKLMRLLMLLKRCVSLHWFDYPHRSRDSMSPVCGFFFLNIYFFIYISSG